VVSLFDGDTRFVTADVDSDFSEYLNCNPDDICEGTVEQYIDFFFGGNFTVEHIARNAGILGCFLVATRIATFLALRFIRYS